MQTPNRSTDANSVLAAHDKRIREASGLLSRLYRKVLAEIGMNVYKWGFLLTQYLEDLAKNQEMTFEMISNERNNLRKGVFSLDMTFDMFVRAISILAPREAVFGVILEYGQFEEDHARLGRTTDKGHIEYNARATTVTASVDLMTPIGSDGKGKLSTLLANICTLLGKDVNNLNAEIDRYLSNPLLRAEVKGRKRGTEKGNLRRELPKDNITWDVFKKALRVLMPDNTTLFITLVWTRRSKSTIKLVIPTPKQIAD